MADNVPGKLGASAVWNTHCLSKPVQRFLCVYPHMYVLSTLQTYILLSFNALYKISPGKEYKNSGGGKLSLSNLIYLIISFLL